MKKGLLLILLSLFLLCGCREKGINAISDVDKFDKLIETEGALLYDIRLTSVCEEGHIPYFMCMGPSEESEGYLKIADNIEIIYPDKNKLIVFVGEDEKVLEVLNVLKEKGYKNLNYYVGGYEKYASDKGPNFVPSVGCDC